MEIRYYDPAAPLPEGFIELYHESFPADERRKWTTNEDARQFFLTNRDCRAFLGFDSEGNFVGLLIYWHLGDHLLYCEHLAVCPKMRGKGIGSKMISRLKDVSGDRIIVEVEPPETEIARRRIGFYERLGLVAHPEIEYVQPPYSPESNALNLLIMNSPKLNPVPHIALLKEKVYGFREA